MLNYTAVASYNQTLYEENICFLKQYLNSSVVIDSCFPQWPQVN